MQLTICGSEIGAVLSWQFWSQMDFPPVSTVSYGSARCLYTWSELANGRSALILLCVFSSSRMLALTCTNDVGRVLREQKCTRFFVVQAWTWHIISAFFCWLKQTTEADLIQRAEKQLSSFNSKNSNITLQRV